MAKGIIVIMRVYPVNFLLEGKPCVVVGGGDIAARKVKGLLEAGAIVTVVSPAVCDVIEELADSGRIKWVESEWRAEFAKGNVLVSVATDDEDVNRQATEDARKARVPVNVADKPTECDFIVPAVLRRGAVTVAIGTGGASPALAVHIRRFLEDVVGYEYGLAADILGKLRSILEKAGIESKKRMRIFNDLVESGLAEKLKNKDRAGAESLLRKVVGKYVDVAALLGDAP